MGAAPEQRVRAPNPPAKDWTEAGLGSVTSGSNLAEKTFVFKLLNR